MVLMDRRRGVVRKYRPDQRVDRWLFDAPYGLWTLADGREVLFNRFYAPIAERSTGRAEDRHDLSAQRGGPIGASRGPPSNLELPPKSSNHDGVQRPVGGGAEKHRRPAAESS
jgi:hypothetical protein